MHLIWITLQSWGFSWNYCLLCFCVCRFKTSFQNMELKLSLKHLLRVYHGWRGVLMKDGLSCHSIFRFFFSSLIARLLVISPQNLFCISLNFFGVLCFSFFFLCFHFFLFVLQVLINGLQHIDTVNVKPKLQMVETFIKVSTQSVVKVICFAWCHL